MAGRESLPNPSFLLGLVAVRHALSRLPRRGSRAKQRTPNAKCTLATSVRLSTSASLAQPEQTGKGSRSGGAPAVFGDHLVGRLPAKQRNRERSEIPNEHIANEFQGCVFEHDIVTGLDDDTFGSVEHRPLQINLNRYLFPAQFT